MVNSERDNEQDRMIRANAERIAQNAEAIRRQTEALELIRDHYYPPPAKLWRRSLGFAVKVVCVVLAYAGGVQAVDWYLNTRKSASAARACAESARRLFFEEGDAAGAARLYERALAMDGGTVRHQLEAAFVKNMASSAGLFGLGRPFTDGERALVDEIFAESLFLCETAPDLPISHILAAQAKTLRGLKDEAIASVERAVALEPEMPQLRVSACAIHFLNGDAPGARAHLDEAERLGAAHALFHCWKGMLAQLLDHDLETARKSFERMTELAPHLALGHANLGRTLLAKGDFAAARESFKRALLFNPKQRFALLGMAESYERERKSTLAHLWLDRALEANENDMEALLARARLCAAEGDQEGAVCDLSTAIDLAPLRADLYRLRAEAFERSGEAESAADDRKLAAAL